MHQIQSCSYKNSPSLLILDTIFRVKMDDLHA
nr:MAG TPA: hypothetical protein [Ackermannviridae sp.]